MKKRFTVVSALVLAVAISGTAACSGYNDDRGKGDAPVTNQDDSPAQVINFPDGFANVAVKCDGNGFRIYSTTRVAPPVVVPDRTCGGPQG